MTIRSLVYISIFCFLCTSAVADKENSIYVPIDDPWFNKHIESVKRNQENPATVSEVTTGEENQDRLIKLPTKRMTKSVKNSKSSFVFKNATHKREPERQRDISTKIDELRKKYMEKN